jgi:hypothetical protein
MPEFDPTSPFTVESLGPSSGLTESALTAFDPMFVVAGGAGVSVMNSINPEATAPGYWGEVARNLGHTGNSMAGNALGGAAIGGAPGALGGAIIGGLSDLSNKAVGVAPTVWDIAKELVKYPGAAQEIQRRQSALDAKVVKKTMAEHPVFNPMKDFSVE